MKSPVPVVELILDLNSDTYEIPDGVNRFFFAGPNCLYSQLTSGGYQPTPEPNGDPNIWP